MKWHLNHIVSAAAWGRNAIACLLRAVAATPCLPFFGRCSGWYWILFLPSPVGLMSSAKSEWTVSLTSIVGVSFGVLSSSGSVDLGCLLLDQQALWSCCWMLRLDQWCLLFQHLRHGRLCCQCRGHLAWCRHGNDDMLFAYSVSYGRWNVICSTSSICHHLASYNHVLR